MPLSVSLVIPAYNEAECIGPLLAEIPPGLVNQVIVADNGSTDGTGEIARQAGAIVMVEPRRGYGYACAAGASAAAGDIVVFMDGDGSFVPGELDRLIEILKNGKVELALGSRNLQPMSPGAMPPHQLFGNRFVAQLLNRMYGIRITDMGPFRALRRDLLALLDMKEFTYGWPVEMMVKVARRKLPIREAPVTYRPRFAGKSKVGGTVRGTVLTTYRIFSVILKYSLWVEK
jgi:glycosyltransferase involved in cell wall biosynthesis